MEFLFDLERAVEAVEKRVPFGHLLMRCLLSGAVLYALLLLIHSLWFEFIWPFAKFVTMTGAVVAADLRNGNPFRLLMPDWFSGSRIVVAVFISGVLVGVIVQFTRNLATKIKALETAIDNYRALLWQPLATAAKTELIDQLALLEKHPVQISANENPDCVELALQFRDCFRSAGWTVADKQLTGAWGVIGATGIGVFAKTTIPDSLREKLSNVLTAAQQKPLNSSVHHVKQSATPLSVSGDVDVWVIVAPKRLGI